MKRIKITVRWLRTEGAWQGRTADGTVWKNRTKLMAVALGRDHGRRQWRTLGQPCELFIHAKDGRIVERATYGLDPRRRKG